MSLEYPYNLKELWENYLYSIKVSIQTPNELVELQNAQINSAYIEKDYDNDVLPVFLLNVNLQKNVYYDILKDPTQCRFIVQIDKYIDPGNSGRDKSKRVYLRDKFVPIITDRSPFTDEKFYKDVKYNGSKDGRQIIPYDLQQTYDFILFREKDLRVMKSTTNLVFTNTNVLVALTVVLGNAGVSNLLMTRFDNTSSYSEFLLPPLPLLPQIKFLDSYFGFYREGSMVFFDHDRSYILRKAPGCSAWESNEIKTVAFTIDVPSSGEDLMVGSVLDNKQKTVFVNTNKDHVMFLDKTISTDMVIGNKSTIFHTVTGGFNSVTPDTTNIAGVTNAPKTTNTQNSYASSELEARQSEMRNIVNIICSGLDISYIQPNKTYKLMTNVQSIVNKVGGVYRLTRAIHQFVKEGDHFVNLSNMELRRPD